MSSFYLYLGLYNLIVFIAYGIDKRRAVRGAWRISEKTLICLALAFGGLGAILGGYLFHHKTRKWYFVLSWWVGIGILAVTMYFIR